MRVRNKLLLGALGFLGLLIAAAGSVYAVKPGDCPSVGRYGPYNQKYDVAFVYGGQGTIRAVEASNLFRNGYFEKIMPLGGESEIETLTQTLIENGVPKENVVKPVGPSFDTLTNIISGNETVRRLGYNNRVAHVSGKTHLQRIKMLNGGLPEGLDPSNDGYFPADDKFGVPIWKLPPLRDSDVASWYACKRDGRRVK